ncbi:hypothetical protein Tco_0839921 [Tanacetum coccineum]|uniref:Uncharacterized protein n=1 Tax=Tanacetum coccineum TaxID=301880 RepID=A0ABQ5AWJ5_9ASTR
MLRTSMVDFRGNWNTHFRKMSFSLRWGLSFEYGCASFEAWIWKGLLMPREVKSRDEIFSRWGYRDNRGLSSLKLRVKKLEKKGGSRTHKLKRLYKAGLSARIESSEDKDEDMFGVNDLEGDVVIVETEFDHEVVVETEVASKDVNLSVDEVTLAQALTALKSEKPKADKVMLQEPEKGTITTTDATTVTATSTRPKAKELVIHEEEQATTPIVSSQQPSQVTVQDKGKGIIEEPEKPTKRKDQIRHDEEVAQDSSPNALSLGRKICFVKTKRKRKPTCFMG